jgi:SAM-dependent methyltransferase
MKFASWLRRWRSRPRSAPSGPFTGERYRLPASPDERVEAARWAYRLILLREPEVASALEHLAVHSKDAQGMRDRLLRSEEARGQPGFPYTPSLSGDEPAQEIDVRVSPEDEAKLFASVQATWHALGETQPHWSVVTAEAFRPDRIAESLDAFYASGEQNVATLMRTLQRNGIDPASLARCIDFGCGVGRLSAALARRFREVVGVDVSASHLAVAREELARRGVANVRFEHLSGVDDVDRLPVADLIFSVIVLQHNPPPVMRRLFEGLLGRLAPGGVAVIQIPTYMPEGYRFKVEPYLQQRKHEMEMHALPQAEAFACIRRAGVDVLEVLEDTWADFGRRSRSNTFVMRRPR